MRQIITCDTTARKYHDIYLRKKIKNEVKYVLVFRYGKRIQKFVLNLLTQHYLRSKYLYAILRYSRRARYTEFKSIVTVRPNLLYFLYY